MRTCPMVRKESWWPRLTLMQPLAIWPHALHLSATVKRPVDHAFAEREIRKRVLTARSTEQSGRDPNEVGQMCRRSLKPDLAGVPSIPDVAESCRQVVQFFGRVRT